MSEAHVYCKLWRKRTKWGLAVPLWGCGWISCISRHPGAHPEGPAFGVLWTGDERRAPWVFALGFSGPWENTSESVTIIPPGTRLAGHFWSSSDPRLQPCCSPFPALGSHWESMTSSSSGITHLHGSFKMSGSVAFLNCVVPSTGSAQINKILISALSPFSRRQRHIMETELCFSNTFWLSTSETYHENVKIVKFF